MGEELFRHELSEKAEAPHGYEMRVTAEEHST